MSRVNVAITEGWLEAKLGKAKFERLKRYPRTIILGDIVADFTTIGAKPGTVNYYLRRARWHDFHRPVSLEELEKDKWYL